MLHITQIKLKLQHRAMLYEGLFRYSRSVPIVRSFCRRLYERWWTFVWNRYASPYVSVRLLDAGARGGLKEAAVFTPLRYLKMRVPLALNLTKRRQND